ncbi:hypothetical protein ACHAQA_007878 [Verticillium albo-atrum]
MLSQAVFLVALAATSVSADVRVVEAVRIIENIQLQSFVPSNVIAERQNLNECVQSAEDLYSSAPSPSPDVESAVSAQTDSCTWTMEASLSEDLMSYVTELAEWAIDAEDDLEEILDDCKDHLRRVELSVCTPAGTVYFTGTDNSTATVAFETALADVTGSGDSDDKGSAAPGGPGGAVLSVLAAAVAIGSAMILL